MFNDWLVQTIRVYKNSTNIEFNWQVGPINVDDSIGKEVIFRLDSDINSNRMFYTDSNGREMMSRQRNARHNSEDFPLSEKVAGNYYPINSRIFIKDQAAPYRQLTLLTDRSQGASSLLDGSIEVMLHRRILHDDGFGVNENLNELGIDQKGLIVKGKFNLLFNNSDSSARLHRKLAHEISLKPLIFFNTIADDFKAYASLNNWTAIKEAALPKNVNLLSLMKDFDSNVQHDSLLVRLEHFYEYNEDYLYSEPVQVDLQELFSKTFMITSMEEMSLGGNMKVEELNNRLKWNGEADKYDNKHPEIYENNNDLKNNSPFIINLNPMQIRTFRINYLKK